MKVLYVIPQAPTPDIRLVDDYVFSLANAIASRGIEVFVMLPEDRAASRLSVPKVKVVTWGAEDFWQILKRTVREVRPHIVQIENQVGLTKQLRSFYQGQVVLNMHSLHFFAGHAIPRHELRVALCLIDKIVFLSQFMRSLFIGRYYGLRLRSAVVYPGVDTDIYKPYNGDKLLERERVKIRREWGIEKELTILFASRPAPEKGLGILLQAMPGINSVLNSKLIVAGELDGIYENVISLGAVNHEQMPVIYRACDIFVYPSQGREALGLANIEALASGLPVVASFRGGITEAVTEECGYLVRQYADAHEWARAIMLIGQDAEVRQIQAKQAREQGLQFCWENAAAQFLQVYGV